jgi:hypothetical protein
MVVLGVSSPPSVWPVPVNWVCRWSCASSPGAAMFLDKPKKRTTIIFRCLIPKMSHAIRGRGGVGVPLCLHILPGPFQYALDRFSRVRRTMHGQARLLAASKEVLSTGILVVIVVAIAAAAAAAAAMCMTGVSAEVTERSNSAPRISGGSLPGGRRRRLLRRHRRCRDSRCRLPVACRADIAQTAAAASTTATATATTTAYIWLFRACFCGLRLIFARAGARLFLRGEILRYCA